jgi:hypothetical protein
VLDSSEARVDTHHQPVGLVALGGERQEEVAKGREELLGGLRTTGERRRERERQRGVRLWARASEKNDDEMKPKNRPPVTGDIV